MAPERPDEKYLPVALAQLEKGARNGKPMGSPYCVETT
jgi:hypothetical protein